MATLPLLIKPHYSLKEAYEWLFNFKNALSGDSEDYEQVIINLALKNGLKIRLLQEHPISLVEKGLVTEVKYAINRGDIEKKRDSSLKRQLHSQDIEHQITAFNDTIWLIPSETYNLLDTEPSKAYIPSLIINSPQREAEAQKNHAQPPLYLTPIATSIQSINPRYSLNIDDINIETAWLHEKEDSSFVCEYHSLLLDNKEYYIGKDMGGDLVARVYLGREFTDHATFALAIDKKAVRHIIKNNEYVVTREDLQDYKNEHEDNTKKTPIKDQPPPQPDELSVEKFFPNKPSKNTEVFEMYETAFIAFIKKENKEPSRDELWATIKEIYEYDILSKKIKTSRLDRENFLKNFERYQKPKSVVATGPKRINEN